LFIVFTPFVWCGHTVKQRGKLRQQAYEFESMVGRLPLQMREKFYEIQKQAERARTQKERGNER
jgi:hypothetical protein